MGGRRIAQQLAERIRGVGRKAERLGKGAVAYRRSCLDGHYKSVVGHIAHGCDTLRPHGGIGNLGRCEALRGGKAAARAAYLASEACEARALGYRAAKIRQFEVAVGVDPPRAQYARVELYSAERIDIFSRAEGQYLAVVGDLDQSVSNQPLAARQIMRCYLARHTYRS